MKNSNGNLGDNERYCYLLLTSCLLPVVLTSIFMELVGYFLDVYSMGSSAHLGLF